MTAIKPHALRVSPQSLKYPPISCSGHTQIAEINFSNDDLPSTRLSHPPASVGEDNLSGSCLGVGLSSFPDRRWIVLI